MSLNTQPITERAVLPPDYSLLRASLNPDLVEAARFLDMLDPDGTFTFQTVPELKDRAGNRNLNGVFHGTIDEHAHSLSLLNKQGAAIFVMVNQGDLKGRKAGNVIRIRALFV